MQRQADRHKMLYSIVIKIFVCIALFILLLLWGWYVDQRQERLHSPPEIDHVIEQQPDHESSTIHIYGRSRSQTFQPRQYVKINHERIDDHIEP